ncbi:MAG: DUF72 domain-containing protein [Chloroflexota bacterium]|nr:DUF72 domain-containing protein [Chloroflexota bacterium]
MKNLLEPEETLPKFFERADCLGDHLGPVQFQLLPNWHLDLERLQTFLAALPTGFRYAFELCNTRPGCEVRSMLR